MNENSYSLSVIVITLNEELNIVDCLRTIQWADDIMVVDAQSKDRTVKLAKQFTQRVFVRKWEGYAAAKSFALKEAKNDWVLWLDADERVSSALAKEIQEIIQRNSNQNVAYEVARRAYFLGKWIKHCGWYPGYVTRLFKRESVRFSTISVHEKVEVRGSVGRMKNDLIHYTDDTLYHYLSKYNRYTSLAVEDSVNAGTSFSLYDLLIRPAYLFFKMYVLRRGFLDGVHGLILSLLSASYVFTKYAKLWERTRAGR